jgi:hypothetical protein
MASFIQHARRVAFDGHKGDHAAGHRVRRLSRSASLSLFVEALETDGCVIIKDFTDEATLEKADREVRPWLEKEDDGVKVGGMIPLS